MTAHDSVILPINYIIWRKSGPVLTGPTGPAPTPLHKQYMADTVLTSSVTTVTESLHCRSRNTNIVGFG